MSQENHQAAEQNNVKIQISTAFGRFTNAAAPTFIHQGLEYVINRCKMICQNLNTETQGQERGPDCARKITTESQTIVDEALSIMRFAKFENTIEWVDNPLDLIVNREYWLLDKKTGQAHISILRAEGPRYYFDYRIWAYPENNQAMERWHVFGPLPLRKIPDFKALLNKGKLDAEQEVEELKARSATSSLHADIMNIQAEVPANLLFSKALTTVYQEGHRDARHAAAELALRQNSQKD